MMAREYNASMFSSNPREIFGISPMSEESNVCIAEIMYTEDYNKLLTNNVVKSSNGNHVHDCARHDKALLLQLTEFINSGIFLDVCASDGCMRDDSKCT